MLIYELSPFPIGIHRSGVVMKEAQWTNARDALRQAIKPGSRIFFSIAASQPLTLLQALADDYEYHRDVEVINSYMMADHPLAKPGMESSFRCVSIQNSPSLRKDWEEGRIDFLPMRHSDIPLVFSPQGPLPIDVALIQVSPRDQNGKFSLGASASIAYPLARGAKMIIAEVNDQAPSAWVITV
jgi:4-hydroxybutyrate CoA-transferase